jgi:hypothetical protein
MDTHRSPITRPKRHLTSYTRAKHVANYIGSKANVARRTYSSSRSCPP